MAILAADQLNLTRCLGARVGQARVKNQERLRTRSFERRWEGGTPCLGTLVQV